MGDEGPVIGERLLSIAGFTLLRPFQGKFKSLVSAAIRLLLVDGFTSSLPVSPLSTPRNAAARRLSHRLAIPLSNAARRQQSFAPSLRHQNIRVQADSRSSHESLERASSSQGRRDPSDIVADHLAAAPLLDILES